MSIRFAPYLIFVGAMLHGTLYRQTQAGEGRPLRMLDGSSNSASFQRIEPDGQVRFECPDGLKQLDVRDFVSWGARVERGLGPQIVLADGSVLVADVLRLEAERVVVGIDFDHFSDARLWDEVQIPLQKVRGIVFQPPSDPVHRDRLVLDLMNSQGNRDLLILHGGDQIAGVLTGPRPDGDPARNTSNTIWFTPPEQADPVAVPREKAVALIINPALVQPPPRRTQGMLIGFDDGSCVYVQSVTWSDSSVKLTLTGGVQLTTDARTAVDSLCLLRPWNPRVDYLSDLESRGYRHFPYLEVTWTLGQDHNVLGGWLRSAGTVHTKGLGMHSQSRVAYRLQAQYQAFQAELAIDEAAGRQGSVQFQVFLADASGQWKQAYQSPLVRGGQPPLPISVDVSTAQALLLVVDFADRGDIWDHACWLSARLIRAADPR